MDRIKSEEVLRKTSLLVFKVTPPMRRALRRYSNYMHVPLSALLLQPAITSMMENSVFSKIYEEELQSETKGE